MGNSNTKENLNGGLRPGGRGLGAISLFPTQEYSPVNGTPTPTFGPKSPGWVGPAAYNAFGNVSGYASYKGTDYAICEGRTCATDAECCDKYSCQMGSCVL